MTPPTPDNSGCHAHTRGKRPCPARKPSPAGVSMFSRCLLTLLSIPSTLAAQANDRPTLILTVGAQGEPEFGAEFTKAADRWLEAAKLAKAKVIQIGRDGAATDSAGDKHRLQTVLEEESKKPSGPLWRSEEHTSELQSR